MVKIINKLWKKDKGDFVCPVGSYQKAQVVPDSFALETPSSVQETQSVLEVCTAGTPSSSQPQNKKDCCKLRFNGLSNYLPPEEDDVKYLPHILEHMHNSLLSS